MSDSVPNPLGLITSLATSGAAVDELLICSFNQNVPFFERVVLAPARSTGARITLLGDINMADLDPAALSSVNRRYYAGNVKAPRTFHPKLVVAVGPAHATIAIGSGNLTMAGWLGNDELWTIHRLTDEAPSPVAGSVAQWCRSLPDIVQMSRISAEGLRRVAERLIPMDTDDADDVLVVSSLDTPVIDQLPIGPVDQLNLYAPFHDHEGEAVRRLVERLKPAQVTVGYQPGLTSANGANLRASLPPGTSFVELPALPYRHGKLVEWSADGRWWSLTGSANLSTAALCKTARSGSGNVELGVVAPSDSSLFPDGMSADGFTIAALMPANRPPGRAEKPFLLAATIRPAGVEVEFIRALQSPASLRVASDGTPPSTWDTAHDVSAGVSAFTAPFTSSGSRMQLDFGDAISNIVYVTDPVEVLQAARSQQAVRRTPPPEPIELFTDPAVYQRLVSLLEELRSATTLTSSTSGAASTDTGDEPYTVGSWQDYLAEATATLSLDLLRFALGTTPEIVDGVSGPRPIVERNWDGDDPDTEPDAVEDDGADDVSDEQLSTVSEYRVKQATRQRCWRSICRYVPDDELGSLISLRSMMVFVAAGGFDMNDDSWVKPVLDRLRRFARAEHVETKASAGSLAAVVLACAGSTLSRFVRTADHSVYESLERVASHLLDAAEPELVDAYAADLRQRFTSSLGTDDVMQLAADVVNDDPVERGVRRAEQSGYNLTWTDRSFEVEAPPGVTDRVALRVVSYFDRTERAVIRAISTENPNDWSIAIWQRPHLLIAGPATGDGKGCVYDMGGFGLSAVRSGDLDEVSRSEVEFYMPGRPTGPVATRLLDAAGLARR